MMAHSFVTYIDVGGAELCTAVTMPDGEGKFPVVIQRSPYLDFFRDLSDEELAARTENDHRRWTDKGYCAIVQHCRGRGKSTGDCIPYLNERHDGLCLQKWVREQPFYNGEIYLVGYSYTTSVHLVTAPFAKDIKGAVLQVQDCERYNCNYRNGFFKVGLHGEWYVNMYKAKSMPEKNYNADSYKILPLSDFPKTVFGESVPDLEGVFANPDRNSPFWDTHFGGAESRDAVTGADIPILLVTGLCDIFFGGVVDMWRRMDGATKAKSALLIHPYGHDCLPNGQIVQFDGGNPWEAFGDYELGWLEHIRGKCDSPIVKNAVTYYNIFGDGWHTGGFAGGEKLLRFTLGEGEQTYTYDPRDPASFKGGLSCNFGDTAWQDAPGLREDILTYYTPEFTEDTSVCGKMHMKLSVRSDCEDTCFYARISLEKPEGSYGLRDDITQISNFRADYVPGEKTEVELVFDEHSFTIGKGERLRIDVSSSAYPLYVPHTNYRGLYSAQTESKTARNTVIAEMSEIIIPVG